MGTWGTKIYQNDISSEVKSDYKKKFKKGKSEEEALKEILEEYEDCIDDSDDRYDFWFGLAETMWTLGRLTNQVKEKALELIDMEDKEGRWETEKDRKTRLQVLEELKQKLLSEMPSPKKISIYKPFVTPWKPGEVYVYQVKNPPLDEAYKPPKDYTNYIGWYVTLYVDEIVKRDTNLQGVPDSFPCLYAMFSQEKPTSVGEVKNLKQIHEYKFTRDGSKVKDYRLLLVDTSMKKFPKDLEYLGVCKDFQYPADECKELGYTRTIWWESIETEAIRRYEETIGLV